MVEAKRQKTFAKLHLQISAELPNPKLLFVAKIPFSSKHSLAPRQRTFNIDPPGLRRYHCYISIVNAKRQKTFAKLHLQISAELPNPKLLFVAKIPFSSKHSLAPRQRTFNIDPPGLNRYYCYTSIVQTKRQKTFAKLDLQISAELPNPKLLFVAKIPFLSEHSLAPRQRTFNIDPPGLNRYYCYTLIVETKCQKTFAKLDLQISAELPNPKLLLLQIYRFEINVVWPLANGHSMLTPRDESILLLHINSRNKMSKNISETPPPNISRIVKPKTAVFRKNPVFK